MINMNKTKAISLLLFPGDSGGPIYLWSNSRAYLIGVVSRGKDCALFNHPGIYTRITKQLPWILQNIKSGNCGNIS